MSSAEPLTIFHVVYRAATGELLDFGRIAGSDADDLIAHMNEGVAKKYPGAVLVKCEPQGTL